jgi:hypothetical protein
MPTAILVLGAQTPFGGSFDRGGLGPSAKPRVRMCWGIRGLNFDRFEGRRHCLRGRGGGGIMHDGKGKNETCYRTTDMSPQVRRLVERFSEEKVNIITENE